VALDDNNPIVLVVDDSPDSLGMINTALNEAGYTVLVSLNGGQALDIVKRIVASHTDSRITGSCVSECITGE
jgi:CheY-like chemotaxis protein